MIGKKDLLSINRKELLSQKPVDITPINGSGKFAWAKASNIDDFERDWNMKLVSVKGMFDHDNEI